MEFHGILHGRDSRKTPSKRKPPPKIYKRKDAWIGLRVHAQREQEATAPVHPRGKRSSCKGSAAGVPAQERRMQHQAHLQDHGPATLHDARLAVAHAGGRVPSQARLRVVSMPAVRHGLWSTGLRFAVSAIRYGKAPKRRPWCCG